MKRIGIIAAMPRELKPLVKGWRAVPTKDTVFRWEFTLGDTKWVAACAGIGKSAAICALVEAEKDGQLDAVLSIGWAGALNTELKPGQVFTVTDIVDTQTGEQFQVVAGSKKLKLLTTARVAGLEEKRKLAQAYPGAALVDMEAATIARLAAARKIPCFCFKAVSDGLEDRLPEMNPFIDAKGQFQTAKFIMSSTFKPAYWRALARFGDNSKKAADNLAEAVGKFLMDAAFIRDKRQRIDKL